MGDDSLRPPTHPLGSALGGVFDALMARPNVVGCYVGRRRRGGRLTDQKVVVACVGEKVAAGDLDESQRVPPRVTWSRTSTQQASLPTDVQLLEEGARQAAVFGPGDSLQVGGTCTAGLGLQHPLWGPVVTTAGHAVVGGAQGEWDYPSSTAPQVSIRNGGPGAQPFTGRVLRVVRNDVADYAVVAPSDAVQARNLYQDRLPVGPLFDSRGSEPRGRVFALTRTGVRQGWLWGVGGRLPIGPHLMSELILTSRVTEEGDSGCCLVDEHMRVWGLLVGWWLLDGQFHSVWARSSWPGFFEKASLL